MAPKVSFAGDSVAIADFLTDEAFGILPFVLLGLAGVLMSLELKLKYFLINVPKRVFVKTYALVSSSNIGSSVDRETPRDSSSASSLGCD